MVVSLGPVAYATGSLCVGLGLDDRSTQSECHRALAAVLEPQALAAVLERRR